MLKIFGFNGSPCPNWSTSQMVKSVLADAVSSGTSTRYFNLSGINIKTYQFCLICKKEPKSEGNVAMKMIISNTCDVFVLGASYYLGMPSTPSHAFLERPLYLQFAYHKDSVVFWRKIKTALALAFGAPESMTEGYQSMIRQLSGMMKHLYGSCVCS